MTIAQLQLTAEQRAIVDHPLEPLRIAAGAGTGKTTTVVARLVSLIHNHGVAPEETLAMTFTNKASAELSDRIRLELPDLIADGREIDVTTYHGFGLRMLSEFGAMIGVERDLAVVGPGYVRQLLVDSVGSAPFRHIDMTKAKQRLDDAANLRAQLAENLVPIDTLLAIDGAAGGEQHAQRLELAVILANYEQRKRELGVVDYSDLIMRAHELVTGHPEVAARIRNRYRIVILDEYQDTDPAQRELLRMIFGAGFPMTAVGDADQTIYEWRGASLENFAGFPSHFPTPAGLPAPTLPLTVNRRSDRTILGVANAIRLEIEVEAAERGRRLQPDPIAGAGDVAVGWFRTGTEEAGWIAQEIQRLAEEEDLAWRDMAILFRRNSSMAVVSDALRAAGVPYEVAALGGLLDVPEVADVHAWLSILARPDDGASLARILLGGRYRLGLGDLAPLAEWVRGVRRSGDTGDELGYPMLEAIHHLDAVAGLSPLARRRLESFCDTYGTLLRNAQTLTLSEIVRSVIDEIDGWAEIEAMEPNQALTARLNLYRLIDLTETWSPLTGRPSLAAFLDYLDLLEDEPTAQELDTARIGSENAVSLLTVHRSKGLEWDTVFIPALAAKVFPADSRAFDRPETRARWLPFELRLDQDTYTALPPEGKARTDWMRMRHRNQEYRTAYVAVTRARHRLNMTGAMWAGAVERPREPSPYLDIARSVEGVRTVQWAEEPGERPGFRTAAGTTPDPFFVGGWQEAVMATIDDPAWPERTAPDTAAFTSHRSQLELMLDGLPPPPPTEPVRGLRTSVTGLTILASCPRRFFWSEIDPLPRRPSSSLRRGTVIHRTIELHHRGIASFGDLEIDAPAVAERVEETSSVDPVAVFKASRFAEQRPILIEAPIDIDVGGVRIRGRVDAVFEPEPGMWEIVDYKSGRPAHDPAATVQLEAYAVAAADGAMSIQRPERIVLTFAYLGVDPVEEHTIEMTAERLSAARTRLAELAALATGSAFPAIPSSSCRSCLFSDVCTVGAAWLESQPG